MFGDVEGSGFEIQAVSYTHLDVYKRQALEVLEKAVAEFCVLVPVVTQDFLGNLLHRCDGDRDERHAY